MVLKAFDMMGLISDLSKIPMRGAGMKGERKAAEEIENGMSHIGLDVETETFSTPGSMALIHLVHFLMLFLTCICVHFYPVASSIIGLLVIASFWGEFTRRFFILRRLLPHRSSINVIGRLKTRADKKIKVVISSHIDAARAGLIFKRSVSNFFGRFKQSPQHLILWWAMIILSGVFIIKAFGGNGLSLDIVLTITALSMLLGSILMIEWELAEFAPGANDNLSGVAVMMDIASKLSENPIDGIDFIFLALGAEEPHCNGMDDFLLRHKDEFPKESTYFINLECLGDGRLKYVVREGFIILQRHHHTLIQVCESTAKKECLDFKPCATVAHSDSIVPLVKGYKSIGIISLNENFVPTHYHRKDDAVENIKLESLQYASSTLTKVIETLKKFSDEGYI